MEVIPHFKIREGGETMRALAWFKKKDVKLIDSPIPDITQPNDAIVKVTGTTICGKRNISRACLTSSLSLRLGSSLIPW